MKICLVDYVDNTPENKEMLDTYEFRNDFWAQNFKFRRRDGKQVTQDELKKVSAWLDREVVKKHRTNWLGKNPEYIEVTDPAVIKKYWPWMPDEEIKERLEAERQRKFLKVMRDEMPFDKWKQMITSNPPSMAKELELKFEN